MKSNAVNDHCRSFDEMNMQQRTNITYLLKKVVVIAKGASAFAVAAVDLEQLEYSGV
jgi:hypothetical protein